MVSVTSSVLWSVPVVGFSFSSRLEMVTRGGIYQNLLDYNSKYVAKKFCFEVVEIP